jgi:diacylglycerol kinase family enzyme
MTLIAVVNPVAGGVGAAGLEHMRSALREFGAAALHVIPLDLGCAEHQFQQLARSDYDKIIIWGGDGTHRTA